MLKAAGIRFDARPARIDEESIRLSLEKEGASGRDLADLLAELKAAKLSDKFPSHMVLGSDQVLDCGGKIFSKAPDLAALAAQLRELRGKTHRLISAAVIVEAGRPVWRHVSEARLTMRDFSDEFLEDYLSRNGEALLSSVGGYQIEAEGVRLFSQIQGDHFTILGMPLVPLLNYLTVRGVIAA